MLRLRRQARGPVDQAGTVTYGVGVTAAVADGAPHAALTGGRHRALAGGSQAPDLGLAAASTRLAAFVLAAVRTAAPWELEVEEKKVGVVQVQISGRLHFRVKPERPDGAARFWLQCC